uniref:Si:ch73-106k19.5 n=1 Tax=Sinocyclocheilus grahami TaxID=75366 RepID=A0A672LHE9_SINGR
RLCGLDAILVQYTAISDVFMNGIIGMIDTIDRPADAKAESTYARSGSYKEAFENKPGKRIPKAGVYAEAGVGRASAEFSIFRAEAKGPNASAGAEATVARLGVGAMAQAEIASASASAGPLDVKLGLGVDTGAYIGLGGVEVKILGCGFSFGRKTSISLLGSELSFSF